MTDSAQKLHELAQQQIAGTHKGLREQREHFGGFDHQDLEGTDDISLLVAILRPMRNSLVAGSSDAVHFRFGNDEELRRVYFISPSYYIPQVQKFIDDLAMGVDHESRFAFDHARPGITDSRNIGYVHLAGNFAFFTRPSMFSLTKKLVGISRLIAPEYRGC